ncbi:MAG: SPOR domain-containing protein, partial [Rhodothermales bacterium]
PRPSRSPSPRDDGSIDWSKGGWTILIRSSPMKQQADVFVRHYRTLLRDTGHPVDVFSTLVQEAMEYRVGVGLFDTEEGAREALASLAAQLPEDAQVVRVPPAP